MATILAETGPDGTVTIRRPDGSAVPRRLRTDWSRVDATTEAEIAAHEATDTAEARRDAAAWARQVRMDTGLTQEAFATRIGVPAATVRNWEQGKRLPRGPARAPEAALAVLG